MEPHPNCSAALCSVHPPGHISGIRGTWATIWNKALPESGYQLADAPDFERYDENFDPRTGMGGVEIWIPIHNGA